MDSLGNRVGLRICHSPAVRATIRVARPPLEYSDLLRQSEADFRRHVRELESSPVFLRLLTDGWVSRVRFCGQFHTGVAHPSIVELAPAPATVDLSDLVELFAQFVDDYGVSQQDFVDFVLDDSATPAQLTSRLHCTLEQARTIKKAVDRLQLIEMFEADAMPVAATTASHPFGACNDEPIAHVRVRAGVLCIEISPDSLYATRYRIRRREQAERLTDDERALLAKLRFLNQRASVVARLITELCEFQRDFLLSNDARRLRPVSQADIARRIKEHPSTVSRALRGKRIVTADGVLQLRSLIQTTREVVRRLAAAHPELSDRQLMELMRRDCGCHVSRRTVSHHRAARAV